MAVTGGKIARRRDEYIGETKNLLRDGYGVYNYANKFFRYEGEWMDGKKHGHGKLVMNDGSYYEGEFQNGEIEGHGYKYFAASGRSYTGQFHEGELQGNGVMKYKDGSSYEGEWFKGMRNGSGKFRMADNNIYQGNFYQHKRHGEGTQVYNNGDRYDGDWVHDQRQGHGELRCRNGTIYDGQWRNDMYNGEGSMIHCSGFIYEGIWLNGKPYKMATKLVVIGESEIELTQGQTFTIEVECRGEDDEKLEDNGREISIVAGYKHLMPKEGTALFDIIEDVEEHPIATPFGYDIVPFPLTDQMPEEPKSDSEGPALSTSGMKSTTSLSEPAIQEETKDGASSDEKPAETTEPKKDEASEVAAEADGTSHPESPSAKTSSDEPATTVLSEQENRESTPLPPPVFNARTEMGMAGWADLLLPAAPPMYRPFSILDDETGSSTSLKKSKTSTLKSKDPKKKAEDDEKAASRYKRLGDERFARPGEYVIMVQDVTNPPFMDFVLEPAFLLVKLAVPKKEKKKKEKLQSKKWDTSKHIMGGMADSMKLHADADLQNSDGKKQMKDGQTRSHTFINCCNIFPSNSVMQEVSLIEICELNLFHCHRERC
ncbi:MORN repeat-containing protein 1-like isoform X3 [Lineus longissimus]|uniref:MORN repeat-containing protein 1-like isoform X3 n=1 Tax=Lineus longissimus TaxID=88925 RepID=UPI002B4C28EB